MNFGRRLWVLLALSLAPAVANSFARFAYALVLPAMRAELGLNYSQAGSLNTANAFGYLVGALFAVRYVSRVGNGRLFRAGMVGTVLALLGSGLVGNFVAQLCFRALAGTSSALVFICGAVLVSNLFADRPAMSSSAIAVYFGGAGVGILLSGVGIPWLLATAGDGAWRAAWLGIGGASALFGIASIAATRHVEEPASGTQGRQWPASEFGTILFAYFLFGGGYIAYMTFVVAWMVNHGASALQVALTWGTLGVTTTCAPIVWRVPRSLWHPTRTFAAAAAVVSVGAAIPLYSTALPAMVLSAFFVGIAMFTVPAAVTDLVKTSLPKAAWASALAFFTVLFALGQSIGPVVSGWLADATHTLGATLAASVTILLAASAAALCQRESRPDGASLRAYRLISGPR